MEIFHKCFLIGREKLPTKRIRKGGIMANIIQRLMRGKHQMSTSLTLTSIIKPSPPIMSIMEKSLGSRSQIGR